MCNLNYLINKPFANNFSVLEYSKLKIYYTCLLFELRNIL